MGKTKELYYTTDLILKSIWYTTKKWKEPVQIEDKYEKVVCQYTML